MKKILCLIMIVCVLIFTGCDDSETINLIQEQNKDNTGMFMVIERTEYYYDIVYHKDTKVMYAVSRGTYNKGTFTLLVNPDGNPMIYEEK